MKIITSIVVLFISFSAFAKVPDYRPDVINPLVTTTEELIDTSAMEEQYKKEQPTSVTKEKDNTIVIGF